MNIWVSCFIKLPELRESQIKSAISDLSDFSVLRDHLPFIHFLVGVFSPPLSSLPPTECGTIFENEENTTQKSPEPPRTQKPPFPLRRDLINQDRSLWTLDVVGYSYELFESSQLTDSMFHIPTKCKMRGWGGRPARSPPRPRSASCRT